VALPVELRTLLHGGERWPVERAHAWSNRFGKPRWCTERRTLLMEFRVALGHGIIVRRVIRRARRCDH
jgi:hypothetical protein